VSCVSGRGGPDGAGRRGICAKDATKRFLLSRQGNAQGCPMTVVLNWWVDLAKPED
jgi:hypothetical protein